MTILSSLIIYFNYDNWKIVNKNNYYFILLKLLNAKKSNENEENLISNINELIIYLKINKTEKNELIDFPSENNKIEFASKIKILNNLLTEKFKKSYQKSNDLNYYKIFVKLLLFENTELRENNNIIKLIFKTKKKIEKLKSLNENNIINN